MDARCCEPEIQLEVYWRGLIPYLPAKTNTRSEEVDYLDVNELLLKKLKMIGALLESTDMAGEKIISINWGSASEAVTRYKLKYNICKYTKKYSNQEPLTNPLAF